MARDNGTAVAERPEAPTLPENATELTTAYENAQAAVEAIKARIVEAGQGGDIDAMRRYAKDLDVAEKTAEKAKRDYAQVDFMKRAEERAQLIQSLKDTVNASVGSVDMAKIYAVGIRNVTMVVNEDGTVNTSITASAPPKARAGGTGTRGGRPAGIPNASKWQFNGEEFSSAELLERFGGEEGAKAIEYARTGWKAAGLSSTPGFSGPAFKLAKRMGWDENSGARILSHEPTAE